jgi:hypothetical protein
LETVLETTGLFWKQVGNSISGTFWAFHQPLGLIRGRFGHGNKKAFVVSMWFLAADQPPEPIHRQKPLFLLFPSVFELDQPPEPIRGRLATVVSNFAPCSGEKWKQGRRSANSFGNSCHFLETRIF